MKILRSLAAATMRVAYCVYPYSLNERIRGVKNTLYSMWVRNYIGVKGKNVQIDKPCFLSGGGNKHITIGDNVHIQSHCILGCWAKFGNQHFSPSINIGNGCDIGEYNHISAINKVTIGNGFLSGRYVYIGDNSHGELSHLNATVPPGSRDLVSKDEIVIGNNVWVGDKVTILAGTKLGDNVIVAANSVVNKSFPGNCMIGGAPAKIIKHLDPVKH